MGSIPIRLRHLFSGHFWFLSAFLRPVRRLHIVKRIPQPSIDPAQRPCERHEFWPGFGVAVVAGVLAWCGARHLTAIETVDGSTAWETQLIKAYSSGGLKYPELAPPPPPRPDDPMSGRAALEQWARQAAQKPAWKVRVDTEAKTPCPT